MALGPVEYIIVGFPGNKFNGEIAPELIALVESGTVRVLDLIFIGKDADGSVLSFEIDELDSVGRLRRAGRRRRWPHRPRRTSSSRPGSWSPTRRRPCLIWEDVWAAPFAEAVRNSGGVLLEGARIPHELIDARPCRAASGSLSPTETGDTTC